MKYPPFHKVTLREAAEIVGVGYFYLHKTFVAPGKLKAVGYARSGTQWARTYYLVSIERLLRNRSKAASTTARP